MKFSPGEGLFITLVSLTSFFGSPALQAQVNQPLELNGILYEVITDAEGATQEAFLWSLELQELSRNYEMVVDSEQRKRVGVLFYSDKSGRDWRKHWGNRMRLVYASNPQIVNDQAEGFFGITAKFPETFKAGDVFALESSPDGATRAYLNGKQIAQSLKPGHFEFWLRAWYTGVVMPDKFRGNLLAGGLIPEDLLAAHQNSELPRPVRKAPSPADQDVEGSQGVVQTDESASANDQSNEADSVAFQGAVPVILGNSDDSDNGDSRSDL